MDTSLWMEHGTKTRSNLIVTPENFVLTQETILTGVGEKADPDEVTFLRPGKAFFTYDEAIAMFEQDQFPKGWRLPTYEEAAALLEEFTDEDDFNSHGFVQKLQLDFYGYVYPKMRDYNEDPTPTSEAIEGKYMEGRFWVYNPDRNSLYAIHVKRHGLPVLQAFGSNSGASIRLVLPTSM